MNTFIIPLLKKRLPDLNEREYHASEFDELCRQEKISVLLRKYPQPFVSAFIERDSGGGVIILHPDLRGITRQYFAWYELARFYLHAPRSIESYRLWQNPEKDIFEAESLPLLAMMPYSHLSQFIYGYQERRGFIAKIIRKRIYLFTHFGI